MNFFKKNILLILAITLGFIAPKFYLSLKEKFPTNKVGQLNSTNDFIITDWQVTGPFYSDSNFTNIGHKLLEYDHLKNYNIYDIKDITPKKIITVDSLYQDSLFFSQNFVNVKYSNAQGFIDFENYFNLKKKGVIYLSCILKSKVEQDIVLLLGNEDGMKVSLNGNVIFEENRTEDYSVSKYRAFAHLKKGENILAIKSTNLHKSWMKPDHDKNWKFISSICSVSRYNKFYCKIKTDFLARPVIPKFHPVEIRDVFHTNDPIKTIRIYNQDLETVHTKSGKSGLRKIELPVDFKEGYYNIEMISSIDTFKQSFFYGDIELALERISVLADSIKNNTTDKKTEININALLKRYELVKDHYKKNLFKIETSNDGKNYTELYRILTSPSRSLMLDTSKYIRFSSLHKKWYKISEIEFYTTNEKNSKTLPTYVSDTAIKRKTFIGDYNSGWLPGISGKTIVCKFEDNKKPKHCCIIAETTEWEQNLERKRVFIYSELKDIVSKVLAGKNPFINSAGIHVRSYISKVDSQPQYYIIEAPESVLEAKNAPLVILMPVNEANHLNFLKGTRVANINSIEGMNFIAKKEGCFIITPGLRTHQHPVISPISEVDLFSAIEDVKKDYSIDSTRIYLLSFCGGTPLTLKLAQKYPDKFAAVSIGGGSVNMHPAKNKWLKLNNPMAYVENLKNTPSYAIHSEFDNHTPIGGIQNYTNYANSKGANIQFEILKGANVEALPIHYMHSKLFSFYQNKSLSYPDKIHYSTAENRYSSAFWINLYPENYGEKARITAAIQKNKIKINAVKAKKITINTKNLELNKDKPLKVEVNDQLFTYKSPFIPEITIWLNGSENDTTLQKNEFTEGPLLDVFGSHFLLINGSQGSSIQQAFSDSLYYNFIEMWQRSYYVKPQSKIDKNVSESDYQNSNLILIGNQHTNSIFQEIYNKLPIQIEDRSIKFCNQVYKGNSLGYCIVYPNPLNPKKYIVLLGGNDLSKIKLRRGNPAENGYFDYEFYDYSQKEIKVLDEGYFNQFWRID